MGLRKQLHQGAYRDYSRSGCVETWQPKRPGVLGVLGHSTLGLRNGVRFRQSNDRCGRLQGISGHACPDHPYPPPLQLNCCRLCNPAHPEQFSVLLDGCQDQQHVVCAGELRQLHLSCWINAAKEKAVKYLNWPSQAWADSTLPPCTGNCSDAAR
jgi:hypothetical protein